MLVTVMEVAAYEPLSLYYNILDKLVFLFETHRLAQFIDFLEHVSTIRLAVGTKYLEVCPAFACTLTFQYIYVEIGKLRNTEVEVVCPVWIEVHKVGTRPVENRHKVVANSVNAFGCKVSQALLVYFYLLVAVRTTVLYCFDHWQRFNNGPPHAVTFDVRFQVVYLLPCPNLAERNAVKGCNYALNANLFQYGKSNVVVLAKPSPSSFHSNYQFSCKNTMNTTDGNLNSIQ